MSSRKIDAFLYGFANSFLSGMQYISPFGSGMCGIMITRDLLKKVKGFNSKLRFGEDPEFIRRVGKIGRYKFVKDPKIYASVRRLDTEGRLKIAGIYFKSTILQLLGHYKEANKVEYSFGKF